MSDTKRYKGQQIIVEGSKSGADVFRTFLAYDSAFNLQYLGDAKYGTATNKPGWYLEKIEYDSAFNAIRFLTATNKIYLEPGDVDITQVGAEVEIVFNNPIAALGCTEVKDQISLKTAQNDVQGTVTAYNSATQTMTVRASKAVIDETNAVVNDEDAILTYNSPELKDFSKRIWDLREQYIYE